MEIHTKLKNAIIRGQLQDPVDTVSREKLVVEERQKEKYTKYC